MDIKSLAEYYLRLNGTGFDAAAGNVLSNMTAAAATVNSHPIGDYEKCRHIIQDVNSQLLNFSKHIDQIKQQVLTAIDNNDSEMYAQSTQLYQEGQRDSAEYIFNRAASNLLHQQAWELFVKRVQLYVNWQYPALELRPLGGVLSKHLVGCDPLYVADTSQELLSKVQNVFTPEYRARLRSYVIDETADNILAHFPIGQFGLVVAHDYFQYRPIELLERYIKEVFELLRPGGHFVFAYNNCDLPNGIDLANNMFYCYTPGRKIRKLLEQYGYEIVASTDYNLNTSWIEARKPGTLSSIRGSQTLGTIVNI